MHDWPVTFSLPHGLTIGGITTWAVQLAGALASAGRDVRLVSHHAAEGHDGMDWSAQPELSEVRVVRAPSLTARTARQDCLRVYRELLPTILLPSVLAESYAIAAALATVYADGIRVAGWNHSDNPYDYACLGYYEPIIHRYVVNTIQCEHQLRDRLPTRCEEITHIPHGVRIPPAVERRSLVGRGIRLVYAGRMEQLVKRVMDLVRLAELLHERGIRFEMALIGDGPQSVQLDRAARVLNERLQAAASIIRREPPILPHRVQDQWREADVSVLTSTHEGLSLQMIEAMACGCVPVVSRVASGAEEMVTDGENGFTFQPGDVETMADRIAWLAGNESAMKRMSKAARETVARCCGYDSFLRRTAAVLDEASADPDRAWPSGRPIDMNHRDGTCRATVPSDAPQRLAATLREVAEQGGGPIAIYGGGGHTVALAEVWATSPVDIVAVIDDDPGRRGHRLWGWPIVGPDDAVATGAQSVLISSWMHESAIWQRRHVLEAAGLRVLRMYGSPETDKAIEKPCHHELQSTP
ncbi:MAG: glycosyltransferase [Phycisphaerae bacterium]|nr:glycosyltransferase [Phycisphaerae bacterium]